MVRLTIRPPFLGLTPTKLWQESRALIGQIFSTSQTKQQQTTNHGQTMQSVETTGCIDNIASSLSTGLSVNPSVGSHTHAAHPLALTLHITCTAHHARTSRTLHIAQHATTSTLAQHTHTHMPHSRLGDRGELSQNSCDRASHERRQGGRRLFVLLSPSCASQHPHHFQKRKRAAPAPERLPQAHT